MLVFPDLAGEYNRSFLIAQPPELHGLEKRLKVSRNDHINKWFHKGINKMVVF